MAMSVNACLSSWGLGSKRLGFTGLVMPKLVSCRAGAGAGQYPPAAGGRPGALSLGFKVQGLGPPKP